MGGELLNSNRDLRRRYLKTLIQDALHDAPVGLSQIFSGHVLSVFYTFLDGMASLSFVYENISDYRWWAYDEICFGYGESESDARYETFLDALHGMTNFSASINAKEIWLNAEGTLADILRGPHLDFSVSALRDEIKWEDRDSFYAFVERPWDGYRLYIRGNVSRLTKGFYLELIVEEERDNLPDARYAMKFTLEISVSTRIRSIITLGHWEAR